MLKVDTFGAQSRTCTSAKALEQHLRGRRHLKKAHQLAGLPPPVKTRKKKAKGPRSDFKEVPFLKFQEKFSHSCDLWVGGFVA